MEDGELIQQVLAGDHDAFTVLHDRHQPWLLKVLFRQTKSLSAARDVAQTTWLKAFTKLSQFRQECAFRTWLFRIGYMEFLMLLRTNEKYRIKTVSLDEVMTGDDGFAMPPRTVVHEDANLIGLVDRTMLEKAIRALPSTYRTCFILSKVHQYECREICEMLHLSLPTVKSRVFRATLFLQRRLAPFYPERAVN